MLYQLSAKELTPQDFKAPPSCYRGAPFWAWNCRITKPMIDEQLQYFKEMGMGGVHIHVRVGLKNQYMGGEFLELVRYCNEKAKEAGLLCWLYDEDRYASGSAGGEVTKNIRYRARHLRLSSVQIPDMSEDYETFTQLSCQNKKVKGCLLGSYDIVLSQGYLESAASIEPDAKPVGTRWFLYLELEEETPWQNNQTYVDTMNEEATKCFLAHTHEKYAQILQQEFGRNIPAIFTDEPHYTGLRLPEYADGHADILLPYTDKLPQEYAAITKKENKDFFEAIPYIVWNRKDETFPEERYAFYEACSSMFTKGYLKPIYDWCKEHKLLSTGHVLSEETLQGQTASVGDAMRCYTQFQLPGVDNLCDIREFTTLKQASSIAHQYHREGVISECYGVTQWDFDFKGYKLASDWQAALGVTTRVPHLAWASMAGEAKRDYPAAIGWQSPWYKDFRCIEDHFARVNYCLTRGEPEVHIAMIHPVESMWLLQGPQEQCDGRRRQLENDFANITKWLLTGGLDFDYICEAVIAQEKAKPELPFFSCGCMQYDVVVIPNCITLRESTIKKLWDFAKTGGKIIYYGMNRIPSISSIVECVTGREELLSALRPWRQLEILGADGTGRDIYVHQLRREGENRWFFLAQAYTGMAARERSCWSRRALHAAESLQVRIKGRWRLEKYDTMTGEIETLPADICEDTTVFSYDMYGNDSLLLHLVPHKQPVATVLAAGGIPSYDKAVPVSEPTGFRLSEPNVFLLDYCSYSLDDGEEKPQEEILRADNEIRRQLGYPLRMESVEQPYIRKEEARTHKVRLRMTFEASLQLSDCLLALEEHAYSKIWFNGGQVDIQPVGFYVDKAIRTIALPPLRKGSNELLVEVEYGKDTNLERMYILGAFGVKLLGHHKYMTALPQQLYWGDYTRQGFPFYTGCMTYEVSVMLDKAGLAKLRVPYFAGAAVKVEWGARSQLVAFLPHDCELGWLPAGESRIRITCLGNRYNGFGQLHMIGDDLTWVGPDSWRTQGEAWTDTYRVKEMGILTAPLLFV